MLQTGDTGCQYAGCLKFYENRMMFVLSFVAASTAKLPKKTARAIINMNFRNAI